MGDEGGSSEDPERRLSWRAALAVAAGLVVFGLVWWLVPLVLYRSGGSPDALLTAATTTRAALLAGFVGLGALGTFWVNSRTLRITARTADVTARTLEVTEQGHITDRYTKAIEQLGDDKLAVRLGGIYALERLAIDSERDHPTVVEVLSAFVREHGARDPVEKPTAADHPTPVQALAAVGFRLLATDVQAAVTVLGRLPFREGVSRGDLRWATVAGADLSGANLAGANLYRTNLTMAYLGHANLTGAALRSADLTGAHLPGATLTGADLGGAALPGAKLAWATLAGANLGQTDLTGADLGGATLADANLVETDLAGADLNRANLTGAKLFKADLASANLFKANLADADLGGANLTGAALRSADLTGADFFLANLVSANLSGTNLTASQNLIAAQVEAANGDLTTTQLPPYLSPPTSWPTHPAPPF